ncbi:DUF6391 domain-containing protein [Natroniella sulfidigena]|uniref:DUF6391 domain-containing protein n=1 Tax=Natroniella sulfidigena TaxID=723921 RepID=UPI00200A0F28|nr:DUF6391 domain-containing protein [Natroniella sulfidigena]MCK8817819.1 DUF6391 domain-containing protein [Natroniella sulfidigena]
MVYYLLFFLVFPILSFVFFAIIFIPYKFTIDSIITLLLVPKQIIKIATNLRLRQNHALEHATINILEERYGCQALSGWAKEDGFYINGVVNPLFIKQAAQEGLARLQRGERGLVVHRRCGTSIAVANTLAAIIFLFLLVQTGRFTILYVLVAIVISNLIGPLLGVWVQKKLTTASNVEGVIIDSIHPVNYYNNSFFGFNLFRRQKIFVSTKELKIYYDY